MRITVLAIGTRGDVQPLLALAVGLQQTGRHKVCFTAPDDFGALARGHGLDFSPLGVNARQLLGKGDLAAAIAHAVIDKDMRARAAMLGERIRAEDGVARAIEVIEHSATAKREHSGQRLRHFS